MLDFLFILVNKMNKHAVFPKYPPTFLSTYSLFWKKTVSSEGPLVSSDKTGTQEDLF